MKYSKTENLIPMATTNQWSIPNDVKVGVLTNGDTSVDNSSLTDKFDIFPLERRNISSVTFPPDKNLPIIRINRKAEFFKEKDNAPFVSRRVQMFCCPVPAGYLMPWCYHNTYHRSVWMQDYSLELVSDSSSWNCGVNSWVKLFVKKNCIPTSVTLRAQR